jgi:hypothetical protein
MQEAERLSRELSPENFPPEMRWTSQEELQQELTLRVERYRDLSNTLVYMMATGCYWGAEQHDYLWAKCLERIANRRRASSGVTIWLDLRAYPALLLLYAGGIASVAASRYGNLSVLLRQVMIAEVSEVKPLALSLYPWNVMESAVANLLPGMERRHTPLNDYLYETLREPLAGFFAGDNDYTKCFDRFEYLLGLVHVELAAEQDALTSLRAESWGPVGSFGWRNRYFPEKTVMYEVGQELEQGLDAWPPLKEGLFSLSVDDFRPAKNSFDAFVSRVARSWH